MTRHVGPSEADAVSAWLGIEVVSPTEARLTIRPDLVNAIGMLLGPVVLALVDYGMGAAAWDALGPDEECATSDLSIGFLASAAEGEVVCRSTVDRRSRRLVRARCEVVAAADGRLLATAMGTFSVLARRDDAG